MTWFWYFKNRRWYKYLLNRFECDRIKGRICWFKPSSFFVYRKFKDYGVCIPMSYVVYEGFPDLIDLEDIKANLMIENSLHRDLFKDDIISTTHMEDGNIAIVLTPTVELKLLGSDRSY